LHQYLLEQGDLAFLVQTATYPAEVNLATPRANLQGGLDSVAKNMDGGKWTSVEWTTHQGLPAVAAVGVRGAKAIRSFLVLQGRQLVTLTYVGPMSSAQSPDVDRFIGSLRLAPIR
jgi:hypothetical protein